jgi:SpoVK/Ycf46/Vps4 family AAA+-type ATPase
VGGYAPIQRLLRQAALTFTADARAFGVEEAKGLLLVGLPGYGNDTWKRAASSLLRRGLLDLDIGAVMGEGGGLIGSAEISIKRALQITTTTKCLLGLSEYEKAVNGMRSCAQTDGGATSRVVGSLLNWLSEPHPGVFVIATANDVRELAPERIRKGRVTPVFVDLPTYEYRAAIFAVHLRKRRRNPSDFDLQLLARNAEGYSGADIEGAVKEALLEWFEDGQRGVDTDDLVRTLAGIGPFSQVKAAESKNCVAGREKHWPSTPTSVHPSAPRRHVLSSSDFRRSGAIASSPALRRSYFPNAMWLCCPRHRIRSLSVSLVHRTCAPHRRSARARIRPDGRGECRRPQCDSRAR